MSISTINSKFAVFTIALDNATGTVTYALTGTDAVTTLASFQNPNPSSENWCLQAFSAAVAVVNTKISEFIADQPVPVTPLTSWGRATLVNSLKASNQIDGIMREMGSPTAIPGLAMPADRAQL